MTDTIRRMTLPRRTFDMIVSGRKTVEVRVAYSNNRKLTAGQLLRFVSDDDECLTRIARVSEYPSFESMLDQENPIAIGFEPQQTREEMLARERKIYLPEKEALGVLAIEVTRLSEATPAGS